jgi:hypothetical protein
VFCRVRKATGTERGGFEPPVRFDPYNGLANRHRTGRNPRDTIGLTTHRRTLCPLVAHRDDQELSPDRAAVVALADPALRVIVESWDRLSPGAREAVEGMVRALLKEDPTPRKKRS